MPRVLVADKLAPQGIEILRSATDLEVDEANGLKPAENTGLRLGLSGLNVQA